MALVQHPDIAVMSLLQVQAARSLGAHKLTAGVRQALEHVLT